MVLAGYPKLRNDLRRPTLEEIGARATGFELEGFKDQQKSYLAWLLAQCVKLKVKPTDILTDEALALVAERLVTPLQIEHYLTLALEQAYRLGEKPVTAEIVEATLAPDINALEPITLGRWRSCSTPGRKSPPGQAEITPKSRFLPYKNATMRAAHRGG